MEIHVCFRKKLGSDRGAKGSLIQNEDLSKFSTKIFLNCFFYLTALVINAVRSLWSRCDSRHLERHIGIHSVLLCSEHQRLVNTTQR